MISRKDLARDLAEAHGFSMAAVDSMLKDAFELIERRVLNNGDRVRIPKFGTFRMKRIQRSGTSQFGAKKQYHIDKIVLAFKPSKKS